MMKTLMLASTVSLATLSAAFAADLHSRKTAPAAPVVPAFTWTGFYAGLNAGVVWSNRNVTPAYINNDPVLPWTPQELATLWPVPAPYANNRVGFIGGAQIGYNYQMGQFVIGAEADFMGSTANQRSSGTLLVPNFMQRGTATETSSSNIQQSWLGTVRLRAGYAADRVLLYVTGGFAYGNVDYSLTTREVQGTGDTLNFAGQRSQTKGGYTFGAGVEYALTNNWIIRGEYLYYNLGSISAIANPTSAIIGGAITPNLSTVLGKGSTTIDGNIVRAAISYKF